MNHFPEGIGKFEVSTSSDDPNLSSVKSETETYTSNTVSLPSRLSECKCVVILIQDFLKCGVVQLEGLNGKMYCLFYEKDFLPRNEPYKKLSTRIPVGTKLIADAVLIKEKSAIPFIATSIREDGTSRGENEINLFSSFKSHEIDQYNMLSRDIERFLPRNTCENNNDDKYVTNAVESNNNSETYFKGQSKNGSTKYSYRTRNKSPGHPKQTKSRSKSPTYHQSRASSESSKSCHSQSRRRASHHRHTNSRSRSPKNHQSQDRKITSRSCPRKSPINQGQTKHKSRSPTYHQANGKRTEHRSNRTRSRSPRSYQEQVIRENSAIKTEVGGEKGETNVRDKIKDIASKVLKKSIGENPKSTIQTHQLTTDVKPSTFERPILYGKGKIIRILDSNYGIAVVLGFGRLCRVLFDIFDVWIDGQVCAELGKTLYEVMREGDLVSLNAIFIESPSGSCDRKIEYMATAVVIANNVEALLSAMLPADTNNRAEVSAQKINNFYEVSKVVQANQDGGSSFEEVMVKSMNKDEIPAECGIFWKSTETAEHVNFFCFHCNCGHHYKSPNDSKTKMAAKKWDEHNQHVLTCKGGQCLEEGKLRYQSMKQSQKEMRTFYIPRNVASENEEEFQRLKSRHSAAKSVSNKFHCFHCNYEGESISHFTSKKHQDHIKDCENWMLDCPENPRSNSAVDQLIFRREVLYLPPEFMSNSYYLYFCFHCKEPFSDKRHTEGIKHTDHMAKKSCDPACKYVLIGNVKHGRELKYVSCARKGGKLCFICNVKLETKGVYGSHFKGSRHTHNVLTLLKKKTHID